MFQHARTDSDRSSAELWRLLLELHEPMEHFFTTHIPKFIVLYQHVVTQF